jgi:hypothetical protein
MPANRELRATPLQWRRRCGESFLAEPLRCAQEGEVPDTAIKASLGYGNPTALAEQIDIEPTRVYDIGDARAFLSGRDTKVEEFAGESEGKFISAFIRANKPATGIYTSCGCKS